MFPSILKEECGNRESESDVECIVSAKHKDRQRRRPEPTGRVQVPEAETLANTEPGERTSLPSISHKSRTREQQGWQNQNNVIDREPRQAFLSEDRQEDVQGKEEQQRRRREDRNGNA